MRRLELAAAGLCGGAVALACAAAWRTVGDWACYRCGRTFVHARALARHLVEIHNEAAERFHGGLR